MSFSWLNFAWRTKVAFAVNPTATQGIGLMSGTSHDGLDIADVSFRKENGQWCFDVHAADTVALPQELKSRLDDALRLSGEELIKLDRDVARYFAHQVNTFRKATHSEASFISSHGVTVFHQPEAGLAWQAGNGGIISTLTGLPVIADFRIQDVAAKGTGAPLIPVADKYLFGEYSHTLNLGGFANITELSDTLQGYDICSCNLLLNAIANLEGLAYDAGGNLARSGTMIPELLSALNKAPYFDLPPPKSLGAEWFEELWHQLQPFLSIHTSADVMATAVEHIRAMICKALPESGKALVTGGGAYNTHLIEQVKQHTTCDVIIPKAELIDFREAIAFAFLGHLRLLGLPNTSITVTGASRVHSAGALFLPPV